MTDALFTVLYELTMMAGYHASGRASDTATFDLYFRRPPAGVDLVVACGLEPALQYLENLGATVSGTQAHSWIMVFHTELEAFREYARTGIRLDSGDLASLATQSRRLL